jgi:hypothetical protein
MHRAGPWPAHPIRSSPGATGSVLRLDSRSARRAARVRRVRRGRGLVVHGRVRTADRPPSPPTAPAIRPPGGARRTGRASGVMGIRGRFALRPGFCACATSRFLRRPPERLVIRPRTARDPTPNGSKPGPTPNGSPPPSTSARNERTRPWHTKAFHRLSGVDDAGPGGATSERGRHTAADVR